MARHFEPLRIYRKDVTPPYYPMVATETLIGRLFHNPNDYIFFGNSNCSGTPYMLEEKANRWFPAANGAVLYITNEYAVADPAGRINTRPRSRGYYLASNGEWVCQNWPGYIQSTYYWPMVSIGQAPSFSPPFNLVYE